jgi:hypothetical protein
VSYPAPPAYINGGQRALGAVPSIGEHTARIVEEFGEQ